MLFIIKKIKLFFFFSYRVYNIDGGLVNLSNMSDQCSDTDKLFFNNSSLIHVGGKHASARLFLRFIVPQSYAL